jgi:hypothetical protein
MSNRKSLDTHEATSSAKLAVPMNKFTESDGIYRVDSNRQAQLAPVKNIAELWLQADLDNSNNRKAHLERQLADVLGSLDQDFAAPVSEIFRKVLSNSKQRPF